MWFFQEGSVLRPCDENLATQIEEGYIKLKPFRIPATTTTKVPATPSPSTSPTEDKPTSRPMQPPPSPRVKAKEPCTDLEPPPSPVRTSSPFGRFARPSTPTIPIETAKKEMIWKLLGDMHMGKHVVYTNANTAWLLSDDLYSKLTASVFQTLSAGVHLGGAKLVRGYVETTKKAAEKDKEVSEVKGATAMAKVVGESAEQAIADRVEEKEMEQDYDSSETEDPNRQIDHLIFCVHGIGQKLGERMEGVNFVHGTPPVRRS
jgi:hypothetical protein